MTETETRMVSSTGAEKGQKLARFDLVPADALYEVAELYGVGAEKYAERNWEAGYDWSLSFAALMRHAWKFWRGEDIDPETGKHHMACVVFHAFALIVFGRTHPEYDNRPKAGEPVRLEVVGPRTWVGLASVPKDAKVTDKDGDEFRWNGHRWQWWNKAESRWVGAFTVNFVGEKFTEVQE
ncbi:dATP/dGTP diphosphohydrolase domain-containing protein [Nocardia salmonicida]|uniref:dATP/dGTP diphosphohydrolase domain-containing protein n=1 Tax=Nocardia salmonicida TaxID=53431 RepID=UPI0033FE08D7